MAPARDRTDQAIARAVEAELETERIRFAAMKQQLEDDDQRLKQLWIGNMKKLAANHKIVEERLRKKMKKFQGVAQSILENTKASSGSAEKLKVLVGLLAKVGDDD